MPAFHRHLNLHTTGRSLPHPGHWSVTATVLDASSDLSKVHDPPMAKKQWEFFDIAKRSAHGFAVEQLEDSPQWYLEIDT